ncbi:AAA-like domain-containing protein [Nodosilinea sp. LEGE 07298]|uniref:AAA-like domain-containing protein n=1 Tax=Nodosilinea sp. LEGE 07298 TaxID=2777970 RepID=UPI00187E56B6|nr:AAA-like domain-containing protein [Nodosilinea sp. LEGE 07298]MBE9113876.1 AAA-like domain-containing protein [Nodosilinea sp. LEGE 07298]
MADLSCLPVVQQTLQRPLTQLEQLIVEGTWQGQRYGQMAQASGYGEEYIKQIGARLWAELSEKLGTAVTKKNLRLMFGGPVAPVSSQVIPLVSASAARSLAQLETDFLPTASAVDFPSGPLPLTSRSYINRPPVEEAALAEITHAGCLLCIKAPRRFGKTSLLQRVIAYGEALGHRPCRIDLQEADATVFDSLEALVRWFCRRMVCALGADVKVDDLWDSEMGSKVNAGLCLQSLLAQDNLIQDNRPLLLTINALEQVFAYPAIARDFLSMLRLWHERSKDDDLWQRLRLVLVYSTDCYIALNLEASPFNVGHSLRLPPFTLDQFLALGRCYQLSMVDSDRHRPYLEDLYQLIAGHPYLANLSFYVLAEGQHLPDLSTLTDGIFRSHLQELWVQLGQNPAALAAWQRVVDGAGVSLNVIDTLQLESLGLIRTEDGLVYPVCELYRGFFAAQLSCPGAEVVTLRN